MWKRLSVAGPQSNTQTASEMGESSMTETTQTSKGPRASNAGPSLAGLMLSKKFAKRLSSKILDKRGTFGSSSAGLHEKEPTYRMEPTKKFNACSVEKIVKSVLEDRLENFKYNPKFCANMTKIITDEIKERVKVLGFDRYKIVCVVVLSQRQEQAMVVSSRCAWDKTTDNYASYAFQNKDITCTATVYGIYRE